MNPDYLGAWIVGLLGVGHCLGMCGGISALLSLNQIKTSPILLLYYNLGRLLSYAVIGGMVGGITASLTNLIDIQAALVWLRLMAAILMVILGLYIGRWWFGLLWLEKLGQKVWPWISPLGKSLLPLKKQWHALPFGMVWGWLPCGLVYSMLTWSAVAGSFAQGALIMLSFGLGTLPAMLASGWGATKLTHWQNSFFFRQCAAILVILYGLYTAYDAIKLMVNLG
ncbi:cytochrome biogenesis protein [Vibrio metoecus]|uniref:Cytochrome biogenesis protein n=1 Tax=Vibrio metoecus TaxID=1481663 RepID=A0A271VN17_VIBMT|nr:MULTISPECIES: sulfite exporter TauE/SafE family protein [Vibrio]EEX65578.1 membrane protein [Vibrio metoecus]KQA28034.1 cytochrome biogenesis protein [Vibrio metoecus]KQB04965.1 cytochrome biogenesis protein [Vibrio metoecus]KQB07376.1 cytochrome biogenesis protein [Vibrio metoecus]KQB08200.1 cytochrome biogenesis protein [Vibrio metoecus]